MRRRRYDGQGTSSLKDLILIRCRFDLVGHKHQREENIRTRAGCYDGQGQELFARADINW